MKPDNEQSTVWARESEAAPRKYVGRQVPMKSVEGKVAFITGGDSGIGLGISRVLVQAGMQIVFTYMSKHHLGQAMKMLGDRPDRVHAIQLDVTERAAMDEAAGEAARVFGKVHVLINNAGVDPGVPLSSATFDDWEWCMNVNVNGVFNGIRTFLPYIKAHGEGGQIVATSSIGGLVVSPLWGLYSASKFAVVGMMEALRTELVSANIGVSVFCPGHVASNISKSKRNRPVTLGDTGTPDSEQKALIEAYEEAMRTAIFTSRGTLPMLDPLQAGQQVLRGILHNDLYILSHPEYAQAIRERSDALLASIPADATVSAARMSIAQHLRNSMYMDEVNRRKSAATGEVSEKEISL